MIRIMYVSPEGDIDMRFPLEKVKDILNTRSSLLWLDIQDEPTEKTEVLLRDVFQIHPLAIEDALEETNLPKIDDWETYVYICFKGMHIDGGIYKAKEDLHDKLDIFKGNRFIITHHTTPIPAIDREWQKCQRDTRHVAKGSVKLLYHIIDGMADDYMLTMDLIDDELDNIENEIFDSPARTTVEKIFHLKRTILHMRRILSPQREVLNKMARDNYQAIDPKVKVYYRDVYDHFMRLYEINENLRDLVGGALDLYLTNTSNKTNEIMKVLTMVATLFMPLTFISGFWGMNFYEPSPNTGWCNPTVMYITLFIMVIMPCCMFIWMRLKKWL